MEFSIFHFHIYFERIDKGKAEEIIEKIRLLDDLSIGRMWDKPVGPHPIGSCQITVPKESFASMVEWFQLHRNGLDIFIHPVSGDDLKDHTDYVIWLGGSHKINTKMFESSAAIN